MKKYESYKESGVDWIGKIPKNWTVSQYKFVADVQNGFAFKSTLFDKSEGFPILRIRDITSGKISTYYQGEYSNDYIVYKGDFLIGMDGDFNVRWWDNKDVLLNQRCCRMINKSNANKRFLYYIMPINLQIINDLTYYTTVKHLSSGDINNAKFSLPPLKEQTQIVKYLDHQTGLIDLIIKKKELLVKKLQEQRQAIINEAVTKGLNPNAKMKDSGAVWLGEIPEHWEVCKIKHLAELKSGDFISANEIDVEGEFPVFGGNGLRGYTNKFNKNGDYILIGRQGALCGNIKYGHDKFWATEHAVVTKFKKETDLYYFGELLRSMNLNQYNESAAQPGLAVGKIENLNIPKISFEEQKNISKLIISKIEVSKSLINSLTLQLKKLKAYRQSIISEAVTGKIDVRDWQPKINN